METICNITDCNQKLLAKGFCSKHYYRAKRGLDVEAKTRFDRRLARIDGNTVYLQLASDKGEAIVDMEYRHLESYNWSLSGDGYPMTWKDGKLVKLHHIIKGKPKASEVTDHINRNKLDNRKDNLRITDQRTNVLNAGMLKNNTSGVKGVSFVKSRGKWVAQIVRNGKHFFGGYYTTLEEARDSRLKLERTH